jgi:glycosyltransferase involved in cell wall biosynthesis
MEPRNLTIVLPAYNEEARLGPALDELFGYLHRNDKRERDGAPGAARLPNDVWVPAVDDASTDATAALVRARPELPSNAADGAAPPVIPLMLVVDVEPTYLALRRGYQVAVVPIRWTDTRGLRPHAGLAFARRVASDLLRTALVHRRVPRRVLETE